MKHEAWARSAAPWGHQRTCGKPRHLPGQCLPILPLVGRLDMIEEFPVVPRGVLVESRLLPFPKLM